MRTKELLLQCKIKLRIKSDYALAEALKIRRARISDYMLEKRIPDAYTAVKIAECLGLDALALIAEFEEATAKNPIERGFWADFRQRAEKPLKGFIMALICIASLLAGPTLEKTQGGVFRRLKHA